MPVPHQGCWLLPSKIAERLQNDAPLANALRQQVIGLRLAGGEHHVGPPFVAEYLQAGAVPCDGME